MEGILQKSGGGAASDECTATRAMVLKGVTAITSDSEDEPVEGTMANQGAQTVALGYGGAYTIPAGYHNGSGKVTGKTDANLIAANIIKGKSIFGVAGNASVYKALNVSVKSSSATKYFTDRSWYYIQYGKIGFTPCCVVAYTDSSSLGLNATFMLYQNKNYFHNNGDNGKLYSGGFIKNASPAQFDANGFVIPVYRASATYTVWIIGYA